MSKYAKGQSGNPAGRPPGSKSFQSELRAALEAHGPEILEKLIERAKNGEPSSGRFLIERLLPTVKSAPVQVPLRLEGSPVEQAEQIKTALAEGLLTLDEARTLLDALRTVEVVKAASELPDRIKEVEDNIALLRSGPLRSVGS